MDSKNSPRPDEEDVHLHIEFPGVRMDFTACLTAAMIFVQDWRAHRGHESLTVIPGATDDLPRLPNERLYLEP